MKRHLGKNLVIALALVAAGFFVAWLRFRSYLGQEGTYSDGAHTYDPTETGSVRYAVWQAPERLDDSINTGSRESRPAISPDGRWFVFAVGERGMNSELYVAEMRDGKPVDPKALAALDTPADECSPAFSSDALYFASDRPGGAGGLDLYRAPYTNGEFGAAERLGGGINSDHDDCDPAPRPGTRELVFASNRDGADFDLFVGVPDAAGTHVPIPLEMLNTPKEEREPAFTADGRTLFFASNRGKAAGDFDLYRSTRTYGSWSAPVALAGLNTTASERAPLPAFDDFSLYFARDAGASGSDLMRARSVELFRVPGRPVGWIDMSILGALLSLSLLAWLAKRIPKLETPYKCALISTVLHLLLFWWCGGVFVGGGGRAGGDESDGVRVQVMPRPSWYRESSGEGEGQAGSQAESGHGTRTSAPERFAAGLESAAEPAFESAAFEAPRSDGPEVPERGGGAFDAPTPTTSVSLADRTDVARRGGSAPGLDLAAASGATSRRSGGGAGPERGSGFAQSDGIDGPGGSAGVTAPAARGLSAPARVEALLAPGSGFVGATSVGVAVASPQEEHSRISGGSGGLSLDALAGGQSGRAGGSAPERHGGSGSGDGSNDSGSGPSIGLVAAPAPFTPAAGPSHFEEGPSGAPRAAVGLHDGEKVAKIVPASAPKAGVAGGPGGPGGGAGGGSGDLLDALGGAGGSPGRSLEGSPGGAPDKHSFAQEKSVSSPAPQALALAVPEDRPRSEPTRPEKRWEDTPYKNREGEAKTKALTLNGGTPETEAAVANGLAYLARVQRANGGWGDSEESDGKYGQIAVGKTGLALLAFLGAGHTHVSNTPYSENAARTIAFLLAMQDESSGHFGDSDAYSHGIATYALGECYALTGEPELRAPLEKAVAHILAKQNHARDPKRFGGWSYYYQDDRVYDRWPRTSITVWQVMALESARLGGLTVPGQVFDDAATFIGNAEDPDEGWYRYNHDPGRLNSAYPTLPASTPAALFALSLVGRDINSEEHAKTREFVLSRAPRGYRRGSEDEFVRLGQGNLYFWYYGTLSMFRAGGNAWQRWNTAMKDTLVNGQRKDGSWAPIDVYCNYARDDECDRSYSTAMCVLSLEVYYRYYLPLLKIH